jgi:hypothetical protein
MKAQALSESSSYPGGHILNSLRESFITQSSGRCRAAEEETSGTFLEIIHNAIIAFLCLSAPPGTLRENQM